MVVCFGGCGGLAGVVGGGGLGDAGEYGKDWVGVGGGGGGVGRKERLIERRTEMEGVFGNMVGLEKVLDRGVDLG